MVCELYINILIKNKTKQKKQAWNILHQNARTCLKNDKNMSKNRPA